MHADSSDLASNSTSQRGVIAVLASTASFVANDALVKFASESLPSSQLIFVRGVFATTFLLAICLSTKVPLRREFFLNGRVLIRAALDVLTALAFIVSLTHLPLANATAIYMAAPLFVTVGAVLALNERVSVRRWLAILAGFVGVLLIMQPASNEFNVWGLLALLSAAVAALRDLLTRSVRTDIPSLVITAITVGSVMLLSAIWGTVQTWTPLSIQQTSLLALASVFMSTGYFLLTVAMRQRDIGMLSPLRYSALIFSAMLGYVGWGDIPNLVACCGMALVLVAGMCLLRPS